MSVPPVRFDERAGALAIVDVRRLLRPREQRIGSPPLPETPERQDLCADIAKASSCLLARPLRLGLRGERPRPAQDPRHAHVPPERRVIDLRPPATRGQLREAHAALPCPAAQSIATEGLNRRVRLPHVTEGIPSATMRSTVATLTPISRANSQRDTYGSTSLDDGHTPARSDMGFSLPIRVIDREQPQTATRFPRRTPEVTVQAIRR